jgi:hypothetical protein
VSTVWSLHKGFSAGLSWHLLFVAENVLEVFFDCSVSLRRGACNGRCGAGGLITCAFANANLQHVA